jgi:quercetin dioxygenase-like cupin family protein
MKAIREIARASAGVCLALSLGGNAAAHDEKPGAGPLKITPVQNVAMTDTGLAGYSVLGLYIEVPPGATDAMAHRHEADLVGYVIEGEIEVVLEGKSMKFKAGETFHEPYRIRHDVLRNLSKDKPAKLLVNMVIAKDRQFYVPEK